MKGLNALCQKWNSWNISKFFEIQYIDHNFCPWLNSAPFKECPCKYSVWVSMSNAKCFVSHRVQSQTRLVVNTTCLELAKPANQQFRLICSQYHYHCLLDETFTKEFEVCREWKWIPGGKRNLVSELLKLYNKTIESTVSKKHCLL